MKLSVVIPAFNEEKLLAETLKQVQRAAQAFPAMGWDWELIVCNNNSTDATAEIASSRGARVVFEPVNQIGRARNTGAAAATGDWILFIDADSHPSEGLFREMIECIEGGKAIAGGSTLTLDIHQWFAVRVTRLWNFISRHRGYVAGSFIFVETQAFREIGGFDNQFYASEEIDLSKRLKVVGRKRGKTIVILHKHPLVTSARKLHLYTPREHVRFLLKTVFQRGKTLKQRDECHTWYDGRR